MAASLRFLLVLSLLALAGCGSPPSDDPAEAPTREDVRVSEQQGVQAPEIVPPAAQGNTVLTVGQVLEIALEGNASTGYVWDVVADGAPQLARAPSPPAAATDPADAPQVVGAPATERWHFEAVQPGTTTLRLVYRRPWETDESPEREAVYGVVVEQAQP